MEIAVGLKCVRLVEIYSPNDDKIVSIKGMLLCVWAAAELGTMRVRHTYVFGCPSPCALKLSSNFGGASGLIG